MKEPTLRINCPEPLILQCTVCGLQYDCSHGDFVSTKLLALAFLKHITERHHGSKSEDFSQAAARIVKQATENH
jgi:hypothetical protein